MSGASFLVHGIGTVPVDGMDHLISGAGVVHTVDISTYLEARERDSGAASASEQS